MSAALERLKTVHQRIRLRKLRLEFGARRIFSNAEFLRFRCNICGKFSNAPLVEVCEREHRSCYNCGSTLRLRSIIHVLSLELFDESLLLPDFPETEKTGIGMSDPDRYSIPLAKKLSYTNTFYHKEPKLDIASIEPQMVNSADFVISSDVFEHVAPPVESAFRNLYRLLKPGGICIFSVPYEKEGITTEHFPELHEYRLVQDGHKTVLINKTKDGAEQVFDNLTFHGGKGSTLVMRHFSESSLIASLSEAGFADIKIHDSDMPEYGIIWRANQSPPISMKSPD